MASGSPAGTSPILDRLASYTPTRALVFGHYGEGSRDVHALVRAVAEERASRVWRLWGARSQQEALSFLVAATRRVVGVTALREMARHRLRRLPQVGVPRARVEAEARAEQRRGGVGGLYGVAVDAGALRVHSLQAHDFHAYQVRAFPCSCLIHGRARTS